MTTDHGTPLAAGSSIGDYTIRQVLGPDAQGFRYLAEHPLHRKVLLHEFFAHEFAHREAQNMVAGDAGDRIALRWWVRSYLDRAHAVAAVRHPRLQALIDSAEHHSSAWYSSAVPAEPLLETRLERGVALPAGSVETLLLDLLDAAEALHAAGIVHRAIGPQLIWAADNGRATLGGFGSLRAAIRFRSRSLHSVAPPGYAAPEEQQADGQATPATDIYAIAAVVHHAACGQPPPSTEQRLAGAALPSLGDAIRNGLPPPLAAGIEHALALDATRHPQSIAQWRAMMSLKAAPAAAKAAKTTQASPAATAGAGSRRWMLIAAPLLLVAVVGAWLLLPRHAPPVRTVALATIDPLARAPTDADRPRFVPVSLGSGDAAPALNHAAIAAISAETQAAPDTGETAVATSNRTPARSTAAPAPQATARPVAASEAPRDTEAASEPAAPAVEQQVASLTPPTSDAITPADVVAPPAAEPQATHTEQLALERARCTRHVSELFADRDFTYADIARFDDVVKLDGGRLETPKLKTDDGRRVSFLIDNQGCIVRMLR